MQKTIVFYRVNKHTNSSFFVFIVFQHRIYRILHHFCTKKQFLRKKGYHFHCKFLCFCIFWNLFGHTVFQLYLCMILKRFFFEFAKKTMLFGSKIVVPFIAFSQFLRDLLNLLDSMNGVWLTFIVPFDQILRLASILFNVLCKMHSFYSTVVARFIVLKRFVLHLMKLLRIEFSVRIYAWFATSLFSKYHQKPKFRFRNPNSNSAKWKHRNSKLRDPNSAMWDFQ